MINIDKKSLLYRLALYGVFFEEHMLLQNGCSFLRRVVLGAVLICLYSIIVAGTILVVFLPLIQWATWLISSEPIVMWNNKVYELGCALWILVVGATFVVKFCTKEKIDSFVESAVTISEPVTKLPFYQLLQAWHKKMCPELKFTGRHEDAHLKWVKNVFEDE